MSKKTPLKDPLKERIYYSQNREDLILESFFLGVEKGFYVDVGANDPNIDSVTKLFYDKGWNGINIEPITHHYRALKTHRSRDINLNIGIGKSSSTMTFHEYTEGDGLSTFSPQMAAEYSRLNDALTKSTKEYSVEVVTLKEVFDSNGVEAIHFLKVDVEGFEYDVLAGNDWELYRPEVICIEANHILDDWRPLLAANHYKLVFFDGLNEYYVDSRTPRQQKFEYVDNVILRKNGGIRSEDYSIIVELRQGLQMHQEEIQTTHLRLQAALSVNAEQNKLYQYLLAENHHNYIRSTLAERALRSPKTFMKYQLRQLHRGILNKLSNSEDILEYTNDEYAAKDKAGKEFSKAKTAKQKRLAIQNIARAETDRLERIYISSHHQPPSLRLYRRLVNIIKRLRVRSVS
jgi:FkbM family methyltransferase